MTELRRLADSLREELGAPPEAFQQAQRARFRAALGQRPARGLWLRLAPILAAAAALAGLAGARLWVTERESPSHRVERQLSGETQPFRFEDGSSIVMAHDARGQLRADTTSVRFELEAGRASFDVTPGQKRGWTITAGKNEVRVVGTRFSVSYTPSQAFEVDVERGVVSVRVAERNANVELKAGDLLRGGPGRMEVVHRAAQALAAPSAQAQTEPSPGENEPEIAARASPEARPAPSAEPPTNPEWRSRYRDGKYADSVALLRASGVADRLNELSPRLLSEVADAARLGGDLGLAVRALTLLMRRFPSAPEARDGQFLLGRVHALRGDSKHSIAAFEAYLQAGKNSRYANESVGRLMELHSARGDDERARAMARRYLEQAPDGPYRRLARSLVTEP